MKNTKQIKDLIDQAEKGNVEALRTINQEIEDRFKYIDELDKQRKNKA